MSERPIVVMKFGGTSVADEHGRSALSRRVQAAIELGQAPVVVVSAMGRSGAPYATDTLLHLIDALPADDRERDMLASAGELISAALIAARLRGAGIEAVSFSGAQAGIFTDADHGQAKIIGIDPAALSTAIEAGRTPVVAGFQGIAPDGSVSTLGRGGSDTTACALGVALGAAAVEIYSDVDGVMSADPRACDSAGVLDVIGAEELCEMARHGSRIVHTPAAELALSSGIDVRVRSTFSNHPGTRVTDMRVYAPAGVATAVSHVDGITRFIVQLPGLEGTREHMRAQAIVYRSMADARVSLDMFTPLSGSLVFTVREESVVNASAVLESLGLSFDVRHGLAKVTLVGAGMHGVPGVMAAMAEYLAESDVAILQTADSHTTISVLVDRSHAPKAVAALHRGFGLETNHPEG
ncbi:MAG: aspartate kinase [Coriobacteriia bacterium]|nr:aspartate kinase [Coriobacteriia bacterium]